MRYPALILGQPDGTITLAGKPTGYLATIIPHENYRLHAEWRWRGEPGRNGVRQNGVTGCAPRSGKIGFQFEGVPFELRRVRMVRLD
jgi:hypothetical protein